MKFLLIALLTVAPLSAGAAYIYQDVIAPLIPRCPGFYTGEQKIVIDVNTYSVWEGGRHNHFARCVDVAKNAIDEESLTIKIGSCVTHPCVEESPTKVNVCGQGSIIKIDNRSVGEVLPITGTDMKLYYFSDRVLGRRLESAYTIPLYDPSPNVTGFDLSGTYADGRTFGGSFSNVSGQNYTFAWDNRDSFGNIMSNGTELNFTVTYLAHGQEIDVNYNARLGTQKSESAGFGGWFLSNIHRYDATKGVLNLGTGGLYKTVPIHLVGGGYQIVSDDATEVYVFNAAGQHTSTLFGLTGATKYSFTYDSTWGSPTSITNAYGQVTTFEVNSVDGRVTQIISPKGLETNLAYDGNGYLNEITNPAGEVTQLSYNPDGLMLSFRKPMGDVSTFMHDTFGALISDKHSGGSSSTLSHRVDTTDYPFKEVVLTSALGRKKIVQSTNAYLTNSEGRVSVTEKAETTNQRYEKSADSQNSSAGLFSTSLRADPRLGAEAKYPGRVVTKIGNHTVVEETLRKVDYVNPANMFDFSGLTTKITKNGVGSVSTYDQASKTWSTTSAEGRLSATKIDDFERLTRVSQGDLAATSFTYNSDGTLGKITQGQRSTYMNYDNRGYLTQKINPLGEVTTYTRDDEGRILSETDPLGRRTRYTYDLNGRMTTLTTPRNQVHSFNYDAHGLLSHYVPPADVGAIFYGNNADKQLANIILPEGRNAIFSYDQDGRLTSKGVWFEGLYLYEYKGSHPTLPSAITRTNGIRLEKEYYGHMLKSEAQFPEGGGAELARVEYSFDRNLRPSKIVVKDSANSSVHVPYMTYDKDELLTQVGELSIGRNENGQVTEKKMGNAHILHSYDSTYGELSKIEYRYNGRTQFVQNMSRDKLGRISEMDSNTGRVVLNYDRAGRFVGRTPKGATTPFSKFVYDTNGNRISGYEGDKTFSANYDEQDRLTRYNSSSYGYQWNGDIASRTEDGIVTHFTYDIFGNLNKVTRSGMEVEYLIDGQDRRVVRKINGRVTNRYIWQDQLRLAAELNADGTMRQQYVYSDGVNSPDYMVFKGERYLFVKDHRGSITQVIEVDTGRVRQRLTYSEFGEVMEDTNPGFQPFGFAGGFYDQETKLVRFGARDYDGRIGRWLSKDPIRFMGGDTNLYGYVLNDPLNSIDPQGLKDRLPVETPSFPDFPNWSEPGPGSDWTSGAEFELMILGVDEIERNFSPIDVYYGPFRPKPTVIKQQELNRCF